MVCGESTECDDRAINMLNSMTVLLVLLLMQSLTGCAFTGGPVEGQVLDYESGAPIPGAIVVGLWGGIIVGSGQSSCTHAETAVSDVDGKYRISRWWQAPPALILSVSLGL